MSILLTGGAGYIGSHIAIALSKISHEVVILDNFFNSHPTVLRRLEIILGKAVAFIEGDIRDTNLVKKVLRDCSIDSVIHLAGLKSVGESAKKPLEYYANNVQGALSLLEAMNSEGVRSLVFSSSATVYGDPQYLPIDENHPLGATNPYGQTKIHIEEMLRDVAKSDKLWKVICLRYFNPVGAHQSRLIGEDSNSRPNNLIPYLSEVAAGGLPILGVFGNDYPTKDGTGIRDYIHVMDLAEGHIAALNFLKRHEGWVAINLGTGQGYSVLEIIQEFERASQKTIPYQFLARREGDIAACLAKVDLAEEKLSWVAKRKLHEMCLSSWEWQKYKMVLNDQL
jgi:UDP-glucose 4-epimerase